MAAIRVFTLVLLSCVTCFASVAPFSEQKATQDAPTCDEKMMRECFADKLTIWAKYVTSLSNAFAYKENNCLHQKLFDQCFANCNVSLAISYSQILTQSLTLRKQSGSFLTSYFAMQFVCTEESEIAPTEETNFCLNNEEVIEAIFEQVTSLENLISQKDEKNETEFCDAMQTQIRDLREILSNHCRAKAAQFTCQVVKNLAQKLYANTCDFDCYFEEEATPDAASLSAGFRAKISQYLFYFTFVWALGHIY